MANIYKKIVDDSNGYLTIIDDILIIDRQHNNFVLGVYAEDKVEQFLLKNYDCRSTETAIFTWLKNLDSEKKEQIINNSNEKIIKVLKQKIVLNIFKEKYDVSLSEEDIATEYKKIRDCCKLPITYFADSCNELSGSEELSRNTYKDHISVDDTIILGNNIH